MSNENHLTYYYNIINHRNHGNDKKLFLILADFYFEISHKNQKLLDWSIRLEIL